MTRKAFRKWRDAAVAEAGEKASDTFVALDNMHRALSGEPIPRKRPETYTPVTQPVIRINHGQRHAIGATLLGMLPWWRQ